MSGKYSPGPWHVVGEWGDELKVDSYEGFTIADIGDVDNTANALLVSAAPDLYESHEPDRLGPDFLDWVADRLVIHGDHPNADFIICLRRRAEKSRNALAKARGE